MALAFSAVMAVMYPLPTRSADDLADDAFSGDLTIIGEEYEVVLSEWYGQTS
jgi:hypothetical protein